MTPLNHSPAIELPPIRSGPARAPEAPAGRHRRHLDAVAVQVQVGAVVGRGQVRPAAQPQRLAAADRVRLASHRRLGGDAGAGARGVERVLALAAALLHQDRARARRGPRLDPGLERHARRRMFSDLRLRTVSHELFPLKPAPRPNLPLTRRTWRPLAPFLWPEPSPNLIPFESASLNPYAATRPLRRSGARGRGPGQPHQGEQEDGERGEGCAGGAARASRGRDRPSPGGSRARARRSGWRCLRGCRPWARERRGAMLPDGPPACQPRRLTTPRLGEVCENFVKSAEAAKIGLPGRTGTASVAPGRSRGRPSTPPNRFTQVRARIDCRRTTGAPLEPKGASTRDRLGPPGVGRGARSPYTAPRSRMTLGTSADFEGRGSVTEREPKSTARRAAAPPCPRRTRGAAGARRRPPRTGRHPGPDRAARDGPRVQPGDGQPARRRPRGPDRPGSVPAAGDARRRDAPWSGRPSAWTRSTRSARTPPTRCRCRPPPTTRARVARLTLRPAGSCRRPTALIAASPIPTSRRAPSRPPSG